MSEIVVFTKADLLEVLQDVIKNLTIGAVVPEVMTLSQVAGYLSVSETTIRKQIKENSFPVNRRLGDPRFIKSQVDAWLNM